MNALANTLIRWGRFNVVGAMGMAVQLTTVAALNHLTAGHYMAATAVALELTLLHNFVWHLNYTWGDRRDRAAMPGQLVRFHLSNGLVSMAGNLALMPVLVRGAGIPVVASNAIAIVCCSILNFCLGNNWAFAESGGETQLKRGSNAPLKDAGAEP
jgi:putative flippase GtrA